MPWTAKPNASRGRVTRFAHGPPDISVVELREALTLVVDAVEQRFGARLQFDEDLYWNVPLGDATTVEQDPELDLGSVVNDAT